MGIKQTLDVINDMEHDGVIERYAIGGAVAAYNYIEPAVTEDLDIFVAFEAKSLLVSLDPILKWLKQRGYQAFHKEGIVIEGWAVQFLPISNAVEQEAVDRAEPIEVRANGGKVRARVMKPEHLVLLALGVGRAKDHLRIRQFLEEKAVNPKTLKAAIERHKLQPSWTRFCAKTGIRNPLGAK